MNEVLPRIRIEVIKVYSSIGLLKTINPRAISHGVANRHANTSHK